MSYSDYEFMDRFMPNDDIKSLFHSYSFEDCREFLMFLERYHILTRSEIVSRLNLYFGEAKYTQYSSISLHRDEKYQRLEDIFGVIIHVINTTSVVIIYDQTLFDDFERLGLELGYISNLTFKCVTPMNLVELKGVSQTSDDYDYQFLFRVLVLDCSNSGGSDLHIQTRHRNLKPYYTVDYRRDIYIWRNNVWTLTHDMVEKLVHSVIEKDTGSNRLDIGLSGVTSDNHDLLGDGNYQLRITVVPALAGYKMTVRIQKLKTVSKTIPELNFDRDVTNVLYKLAKKQSGLTLITGPIRTGKNTTAFAMANSMPLTQLCVMDLSSPVEVRMDFTQVDYKDNVENLLNQIKLMKKLDVDLCFLNEIPSKDVAFAVRDLVNSSVGVITTMHIDRIWHLPHKLKEYYGDEYKDVLSQINGVVTQKMFVRQCENCADTALISTLPQDIQAFLNQERFSHIPGNSVKVNTGCSLCFEGNARGALQPYAEVLLFTEELKYELRKCNYAYEMELLIKNLMDKNKNSLDYKLVDAVKRGALHYQALYSIL